MPQAELVGQRRTGDKTPHRHVGKTPHRLARQLKEVKQWKRYLFVKIGLVWIIPTVPAQATQDEEETESKKEVADTDPPAVVPPERTHQARWDEDEAIQDEEDADNGSNEEDEEDEREEEGTG